MMSDIATRVRRLDMENLAGVPRPIDPLTGRPEPVSGVNLAGVDEFRKRLTTFFGDALRSNNAADIRAARRIMDAFDADIDTAVNTGYFSGDPRAINAWNAARARHSAYRSTFGQPGRNRDPVSAVVQRIIGDQVTPAATSNQIADFISGSSNLVPQKFTAAVARRLREIVGGSTSDVWTEAKQGVFLRAIEPAPGQTAFTDKQVADRVADLIGGRGSDVAREIFSDAERALIRSYGELRRRIQTPVGAGMPVEAQRLTDNVLRRIAGHVGGTLGRGAAKMLGTGFLGETALGAGAQFAAERAVQGRPMLRYQRQIQQQMPIIGNVLRDYQRAVLAYDQNRGARAAARLTLAVRNLEHNLRTIGISNIVAGSQPIEAEDRAKARAAAP